MVALAEYGGAQALTGAGKLHPIVNIARAAGCAVSGLADRAADNQRSTLLDKDRAPEAPPAAAIVPPVGGAAGEAAWGSEYAVATATAPPAAAAEAARVAPAAVMTITAPANQAGRSRIDVALTAGAGVGIGA